MCPQPKVKSPVTICLAPFTLTTSSPQKTFKRLYCDQVNNLFLQISYWKADNYMSSIAEKISLLGGKLDILIPF